MLSPARIAAYEILRKVDAGGYASDLLLRSELDSRDAGLASQIVFGVLRYRAQLDFLIDYFAGRSPKLDPEVRAALRMGIFQLRYLERVPAHAAVSESAELVKRARKTSAVGMVNAVLRKAGGDVSASIAWPNRAVALSCPEWLLARWEQRWGAEIAEGIARTALQEPETYVRIGAAGARRQDIGSQSIVPWLRLEPGQRVLDLCAAPGNKTAQMIDAGARVVACDVHFHRLLPMKTLGVELVLLDGTAAAGLPFPAGCFDRVLVDAPCSGSGTLGRNPEIKWRLRPEDLLDLQRRQKALLAAALAVLSPGGLLVYATCSLEAEENEHVAAAAPAVWLCHTQQRIPGRDLGDGFYAAVIKSNEPAND